MFMKHNVPANNRPLVSGNHGLTDIPICGLERSTHFKVHVFIYTQPNRCWAARQRLSQPHGFGVSHLLQVSGQVRPPQCLPGTTLGINLDTPRL